MTDRPPPEELMAMGLFIHEFGQLERTIDDALADALAIIPAPKQGHRIPDRFQKRVQMLETLHRIKLPMKACRSKAEPLLEEIKKLLLMRNDVAHGRLDEYHHDLDKAAARVAVLNQELAAAMEWRGMSNAIRRVLQRARQTCETHCVASIADKQNRRHRRVRLHVAGRSCPDFIG